MKLARLAILLALTSALEAHLGSPDVYLDARAGPYKLFITVRPPTVIPGVAALEVRAESSGVRELTAVPVLLSNRNAQLAPVPDVMKVSPLDAQFFTGSLWMMASGSWQILIHANGAQGEGSVAVPIPSVALATKPMSSGLAIPLLFLMCLLIAGLVLMIGASVREAKLPAGVKPDAEANRRARRAMTIALVLVTGIVALGLQWWNRSEKNYRTKVYKPLEMQALVSRDGTLDLRLKNPPWMNRAVAGFGQRGVPLFSREMDDFVPDHDHLMHLYAIRQPGLDVVYHLHPQLVQPALFRLKLPKLEPGSYRLYADVVHANGFAETIVSTVEIPPGLPNRPLSGDDAGGKAEAWQDVKPGATRFQLSDGYIMEWVRTGKPLQAKAGEQFCFRLLDSARHPADGVQFYMGMLGHAAFVKVDSSTFAHVHPAGSVPMASYMMAQQQLGRSQTALMEMSAMEMPGMEMGSNANSKLPSEVMFPYGFPSPGRYRIFVQMKHQGIIETGVFDALVRE